MLRVTLDSSAYISALQFNGRAARLLRMAADNDIEIAISEPIIAEVIGVLREKFGWDGYRLHAEWRAHQEHHQVRHVIRNPGCDRLRSLCVAKLASVPEIREFRVDAAVLHGDVTPSFRD